MTRYPPKFLPSTNNDRKILLILKGVINFTKIGGKAKTPELNILLKCQLCSHLLCPFPVNHIFKKCFTEIWWFSFQLKCRVSWEILDYLKIFHWLYFSNQFGDDLLFLGKFLNPRWSKMADLRRRTSEVWLITDLSFFLQSQHRSKTSFKT